MAVEERVSLSDPTATEHSSEVSLSPVAARRLDLPLPNSACRGMTRSDTYRRHLCGFGLSQPRTRVTLKSEERLCIDNSGRGALAEEVAVFVTVSSWA